MSSSAAIPIVAPSSSDDKTPETKKSPAKFPASISAAGTPSKARLCRNVVIHGYCKYENRGCEFNHETIKAMQSPDQGSSQGKLRVNSPVFTPNAAAVSSEAVNAPVFVPKLGLGIKKEASVSTEEDAFASPTVRANGKQIIQQHEQIYVEQTPNKYDISMETYDPTISYYTPTATPNTSLAFNSQATVGAVTNSFAQFNVSPEMHGQSAAGSYAFPQRTYDNFYGHPPILHQHLLYHLYTVPLPHVSNLHPHQKTVHSFFMSDKLREELTERNEAIVRNVPTQDLHLPQQVHVYHSLFPLDEHHERSNKTFGYSTKVYKVTCSLDAKPYVFRRIEGFRLTNEAAMSVVESWRRIRHANIISIREAFTTKAFGDHSLVLVYDYHPCSITLLSKHFSTQLATTFSGAAAATNVGVPHRGRMASGGHHNPDDEGTGSRGVSEKVLWSYVTQIASAIKTAHTAGLAIRTMEPSKILLTGKNRIRINCCGVFDLLNYDGGKSNPHYQQEDLLHFGQLILSIACSSLIAIHNLPKSLDYMTRYYSPDLKNVVLYLLSKPTPMKTVDDVVAMIGPRILHGINSAQNQNDFLEAELSKELENGRLVRLLCKFGFINERPEFDMDPSWSETGDRYLLKLFRDYVFHQVDERGRPVLDMAHVLQCLNKLDAGVDERVMLVSRDEQSCLIVSYRELKKCAEEAWRDLFRKSA